MSEWVSEWMSDKWNNEKKRKDRKICVGDIRLWCDHLLPLPNECLERCVNVCLFVCLCVRVGSNWVNYLHFFCYFRLKEKVMVIIPLSSFSFLFFFRDVNRFPSTSIQITFNNGICVYITRRILFICLLWLLFGEVSFSN